MVVFDVSELQFILICETVRPNIGYRDLYEGHAAELKQWKLDHLRLKKSMSSAQATAGPSDDADIIASSNIGSNAGDFMFIHSQKGRIQLKSHDGYMYVKEKNVNEKIYWRCTRYTTKLRCHARIHTLKHEIVRQSQHNHDPLERHRTDRRTR